VSEVRKSHVTLVRSQDRDLSEIPRVGGIFEGDRPVNFAKAALLSFATFFIFATRLYFPCWAFLLVISELLSPFSSLIPIERFRVFLTPPMNSFSGIDRLPSRQLFKFPSRKASILDELVFGHIVDHSRIVTERECCPKSNSQGLIGPVAEYKFVREK
jgi:hypothetical protein